MLSRFALCQVSRVTVLPKGKNHRFLQSELTKAKSHFENEKYLQSLAVLDALIESSDLDVTRYIRALVRERVNDLTGSLSDIWSENLDPDRVLAKARVQVKLGFCEDAVCTLRTLLRSADRRHRSHLVSSAIGIAGRRFDLELLELWSGQKGGMSNLSRWMKGCALEHLIALGEFAACRLLFRGLGDREFSLLSISKDVENADELRAGIAGDPPSTLAERAIKGTRGWLSLDEAAVLVDLAARVPSEQTIVEIGSFQGRSTCALAAGSKAGSGSTIHAVDTHAGLPGISPEGTLSAFRANLRSKRLSPNVTIHLGTSVDIACHWNDQSIGLLFVDGDHDYESVKKDFESWLPHLSVDGLIAFHDSNQTGPNRLICEIIGGSSENIHMLGLRDSLAVLQLSEPDSKVAINQARRKTWLEYLTILGQNYSKWDKVEQIRLDRNVLDSFDHAMRILHDSQSDF